MTDVFLSYSRDDLTVARRFAEGFEREGLTVWWDQTLIPGEAFDEVTEKALNEAKAVVVLWSKTSVGSRWVRAEATQAHDNKTLVPVMIEACKRPIMFELTHTADLSNWKGDMSDPAWRTFVGNVRQLAKNEGRQAAAPDVNPVVRRPGRFSAGAMVGILVAVLGALGLGLWGLSHKPGDYAKEVTLAVLPFANLSSDPEQEYFSDGLTEEILNQLAQIDGLAVTARTSSFFFKGKNQDVRSSIGAKLGVAHLLEGSIRKEGNQLRITAQLVSSADGAHHGRRTYDRELSGVFQLQEQIAKDVAQALSVKLDVGDTAGRRAAPRTSRPMTSTCRLTRCWARATTRTPLPRPSTWAVRWSHWIRPSVRGWEQLAYALYFMQVWSPESATALRDRGSAGRRSHRVHSAGQRAGNAHSTGSSAAQRKWLDAAALVKTAAGAAEVQRSVFGFL